MNQIYKLDTCNESCKSILQINKIYRINVNNSNNVRITYAMLYTLMFVIERHLSPVKSSSIGFDLPYHPQLSH